MRGKTRQAVRLALLVLLLPAMVPTAGASPEYIQSQTTGAGSVKDAPESTEYAFRIRAPLQAFSLLRDVLRSGSLDLGLRNYYFARQRDNRTNMESWAQGGALTWSTPRWKDRVRAGATLYTSQKLYGPGDKDGALLLKPGQKSFTVLGEAWLDALVYSDLVVVRGGRQSYDLPYLNGFDNRMVPNTFESLVVYNDAGYRLDYVLAHTWRIKQRNANDFVSMTEAAGIEGPDRSVTTAGARFRISKGANIGALNHYSPDFMNVFYAEFNSRSRDWRGAAAQLSAQYTRQNATGSEVGGDFDTRTWAVKLAASVEGFMLTLARSSTSNNSGMRSPWGGRPGYLSLMIEDFDRAGEDAWLVGLSSDFSYFGDNGFSTFINYAWGDMPDRDRNAGPDQSELDITVDYKPRAGILKGLWFRLRGARVHRQHDSGTDLKEIRFITNYDFNVL